MSSRSDSHREFSAKEVYPNHDAPRTALTTTKVPTKTRGVTSRLRTELGLRAPDFAPNAGPAEGSGGSISTGIESRGGGSASEADGFVVERKSPCPPTSWAWAKSAIAATKAMPPTRGALRSDKTIQRPTNTPA